MPALGTVKVLAIGGGGAGGETISNNGGGGGAGGYQYDATHSVSLGTYPIVVGGGGVFGSHYQGYDSTFDTITAYGGGAGGQVNVSAGANGGCGGGGGATKNGGTGSQGGNGSAGSSGAGGGGGGTGQNGQSSSSGVGGNGGNGTSNSITGSAVIYGGGGGGGGGTDGTGGTGGGGNGCVNTGIHNGTNGLGGGGGGGGGSGGSGVVIIAYHNDGSDGMQAIGGTITTVGGFRIHTFTSSGNITFYPSTISLTLASAYINLSAPAWQFFNLVTSVLPTIYLNLKTK